MLDLLLIMALGFLGSFGHCAGMCGPLTVAFSLGHQQQTPANWRQQFYFHILLNLGRIASYALTGAFLGGVGSMLIAGGQLAGIGSDLRRAIAIFTGIMLIWLGLVQIKPDFLPRLPVLHPLKEGGLHNRLRAAMMKLSLKSNFFTPALLGLVWGLIPCGFLYNAQLKAAETANLVQGATTMLAFGLGTLPMMLGVGVFANRVSADKRSQLFRLGGWVTLAIGAIALLRTGDTMVDYTGHAALLCLILALIARPISRFFSAPLRYRRVLGVGAYVLALAHTAHMLEHTLNWNFQAIPFMLPTHQLGMSAGAVALVLMTPAALTSFDRMQQLLGKRWRQIHLLSLPAFLLCAVHAVLIGSHYLGGMQQIWSNKLLTVLLGVVTLLVLLVRYRGIWSLLSLEKLYVPPSQSR
ncbi:sulfite exporter TauE/SafE family protein [Trichocoleus sp. FACHB-90]|uniref:urease accessory protein UreH domain-containing protein n=1 Tax=Cyanophyceae TaxID=3028117 RepID=UPI001681D922|nr:sulfite exporter TauE/SafE family protein [Trichocoleus sp. FACHB-90]MBD1928659.1 sulfite exporter TauE/SafE family protein [Trichocoleus sp. FACHB-90]